MQSEEADRCCWRSIARAKEVDGVVVGGDVVGKHLKKFNERFSSLSANGVDGGGRAINTGVKTAMKSKDGVWRTYALKTKDMFVRLVLSITFLL